MSINAAHNQFYRAGLKIIIKKVFPYKIVIFVINYFWVFYLSKNISVGFCVHFISLVTHKLVFLQQLNCFKEKFDKSIQS